jgi:two-component system response regulator AtoC
MSRFGDTSAGDESLELTSVEDSARPTLTSTSPGVGKDDATRLSVLIISDRLVTTRPLPSSGEVTIGRAPGCGLVIDDPSISRTHAALTVGPPISLRDLGSANGSRVRDRQLQQGESAELQPGDVIMLGNATLIVQRRAPPVRAQRIWAHDYFEVRLEEECARAQRDGNNFAVARLRCDPPPPAGMLQDALVAVARASDVVGTYGPNEFELLLIDTEPDAAAAAIERLSSHVGKSGFTIQSGVACFPRDGRHPDELIHKASPFQREQQPGEDAAVSAAIVADRRMQDLYRLAERIAAGNITVLILGETGVGKEVLAERVHRLSPRTGKPYLKLNCAALSETLLESELFGHERGAFTGAVGAKKGLLETADGGTVFLDEVGELPHSIQVKLLRVIEERVVTPVGGLKPRPLDVRFIAATNRDLEHEIGRGSFRQDLFFRLNGATLVIPPLRERTSEIADLARAFIAQAARQMGLDSQPSLSSAALEVLLAYPWPGNIRELRNVVERAVLLCTGRSLLPEHLPLEKMRGTVGVAAQRFGSTSQPPPIGWQAGAVFRQPAGVASGPPPGVPASPPAVTLPPTIRVSPAEAEKDRILEALAACGGNQTEAARTLGIARRTLINKLELHGISGPRKRR